MGSMYNDFRNPSREEWKYTYKGKEIASAALANFRDYKNRESNARSQLAAMVSDQSIKSNDPIINDIKRKIEIYGDIKEKCIVWYHEFVRTPERDFHLALSDVTFFDLAKAPDDESPKL